MMTQNLLPIKVKNDGYLSGLTSLAGMLVYLELMWACRLRDSIERNVQARSGGQGWTDSEICIALILLNLAGGDCVNDLRTLESDDGFCRLLKLAQQSGLNARKRRKLMRRWRRKTHRMIASSSSVFRYLESFHDEEQEIIRDLPTTRPAFIPKPLPALVGLSLVNRDLIEFAQLQRPSDIATIDMDATLIPTNIETAKYCYKAKDGQIRRAFQPLNCWWSEHGLMLYTEFRDGNVNAGFEQLRVFKQALEHLPAGVKSVRLRSDSAGYQHNLLKYCEKSLSHRFGRIEFAVSCSRSVSFRQAVAEVPNSEWHRLYYLENGELKPSVKEWAEVCFVPEELCKSKNGPSYRYLATREPSRNPIISGLEQTELPLEGDSDYWNCGQYRLFGIVTNITDWEGGDVINWLHERCGYSEQAHSVIKNDLAGGQMPSRLFGANAAWWWLSVIAHNLQAIMKQHVLPEELRSKRLKAIRFSLINIPARIVSHARYLIMQLSSKQHMADLIMEMRRRIASLVPCPSG